LLTPSLTATASVSSSIATTLSGTATASSVFVAGLLRRAHALAGSVNKAVATSGARQRFTTALTAVGKAVTTLGAGAASVEADPDNAHLADTDVGVNEDVLP